jgi:hypothetical protein
LDAEEIQILRGPNLTVTNRRIVVPSGEIQVAATAHPELEHTATSASATPVVATIGLVIFALGLMAGGPLVWILGLGIAAFSAFAKVKRQGFSVTVNRDGERQPIYTTNNEADAKLALAALIEAQKRSAS